VAFWLLAFVAAVIIHEFWRATWARHIARQESLPLAFWRLIGKNRPRYGGFLIHLGVVLMALGIVGIEVFQTETQGTVAQGGEVDLGRYTIKFNSLSVFNTNDGRNVARAVVSVFEDGKYVGELYPRRDYYYESQQNITIVGLRSTPRDDLYVILADWQPLSTAGATFKVYDNPLVWWLWRGMFIFVLGTIIALWPAREPEPALVTRAVPAATSEAVGS
jgi:cytochrome c-type biogenesis protein CcmF